MIYVFNNNLRESDRPPGWRYYKSCTQNFRHLQVHDIHLAPRNSILYNSSQLHAIDFLCPLFHDIHVAHNTSVIYILHQTLPSITIRPRFTKLSNHLSLASVPAKFPPFPMKICCVFTISKSTYRFDHWH